MDGLMHDLKDFITANPIAAVVVVVLAFVILFDRMFTKFLRVIDRLAKGRSE